MRDIRNILGSRALPGTEHYAGQVVSATDLREQVKQQTNYGYFGADSAHRGMYHTLKDYEFTIRRRWQTTSKIDKRNLWLIGAGATLLCAMGAAFIAGLPDSYGSDVSVFGWEMDMNWVVDPIANALFIVTLLPMLKLALRNRYADYVAERGSSEHDVLLGLDDLEASAVPGPRTENPQYNIKQWAEVKSDLAQIDFIRDSHDAKVKRDWIYRAEITCDNLPAYVAMTGSRLYNTGLTKVAILTLLPYLMAKMPGATAETTGSYKGMNFLWEVMAGFAVLMLHGQIRNYVVKPLSWGAGNLAYGAVALMRAVGSSPYCCCLPEDTPRAIPAAVHERRVRTADSLLEEQFGQPGDMKFDDRVVGIGAGRAYQTADLELGALTAPQPKDGLHDMSASSAAGPF